MTKKHGIGFFIGLFVVALLNMLGFLAFQFYVSKQYIFAEKTQLTALLDDETLVGTQGSSDPLLGLQTKIVQTVQTQKQSVVNIVVTKNLQFFLQNPRGYGGYIAEKKATIGGGSGIFVHTDGYVLTNKHVVADIEADYTVVAHDGTTYVVQQIWRDPVIDIAMLKISMENSSSLSESDTSLSVAQFIDFGTDVSIGQFVLAIGNALAEYHNSVTLGILSATNRKLDVEADSLYIGLYQTDTSINPGNSGGPLFDIQGRVIGINTAVRAGSEGIGFALPVTQGFVDATIRLIQTYNQLHRPFVGIQYLDLNKVLGQELELDQDRGTYVQSVVPNSPAALAGLVSGDVITHINDYEISSDIPFLYHIYQYIPGDEIVVRYQREGKEYSVSLILSTYDR